MADKSGVRRVECVQFWKQITDQSIVYFEITGISNSNNSKAQEGASTAGNSSNSTEQQQLKKADWAATLQAIATYRPYRYRA